MEPEWKKAAGELKGKANWVLSMLPSIKVLQDSMEYKDTQPSNISLLEERETPKNMMVDEHQTILLLGLVSVPKPTCLHQSLYK